MENGKWNGKSITVQGRSDNIWKLHLFDENLRRESKLQAAVIHPTEILDPKHPNESSPDLLPTINIPPENIQKDNYTFMPQKSCMIDFPSYIVASSAVRFHENLCWFHQFLGFLFLLRTLQTITKTDISGDQRFIPSKSLFISIIATSKFDDMCRNRNLVAAA